MSTTIAPAGATQRAFTTGGYLQTIPAVEPRSCEGCRFSPLKPPGLNCPRCGWAPPGQEGQPYPAQSLSRFSWVYDQQRIATPAQRAVLLALVWHDMPGGKGIFPSVVRLAEMTRYSRRTVISALQELERAGWIVRHKTRNRGRQGRSFYLIQQPECVAAGLAGVDKDMACWGAQGAAVAPRQGAAVAP